MLKKPRILVVGSFMMDLIVSGPRVPNMGETVIGTAFRTAPGGKGSNLIGTEALYSLCKISLSGFNGIYHFPKLLIDINKSLADPNPGNP